MKFTSTHWLQERGTREGNRLIFSRPWRPSCETDIRETFARVQRDNDWATYMERAANYEAMRDAT
jgi:hypothetical protein